MTYRNNYTERKDWLLQQIKKLNDKIWHSILNWLQQPIFGCVSQSKSYTDIADRLT